jgi:hypothetical protein
MKLSDYLLVLLFALLLVFLGLLNILIFVAWDYLTAFALAILFIVMVLLYAAVVYLTLKEESE